MQELWDTILRKTDLWFIDIDEDQWHKLGRQQDHRRHSPKSRNVICIIDTKSTLNFKRDQKNSPWCVMIKTLDIQNNDGVLKTTREKLQVTYKGKPIRIVADPSVENLRARRA